MNNNLDSTISEQKVEQKISKKPNKFIGFIKNLWRKVTHSQYSYLFFSFLLPLCLMRLIYVAVGVFPGFDGSVLVLDLNGQYVYFYEALRNFIYGDASLLYSFSRALGGEFFGIFAYYVASPFAWIIALFPKGGILEALLTIFVLKAGLCGLSFGFYLHKTSARINRWHIVTVSTMYALCSYAVVQSHNSMWIDALIWLPIITYAIEQLIKQGHCKLLIISLSLMLMSHYYIGYMVCIYVALYFFYYYLAHKGSNEIEENHHFIRSFSRITLSAFVSLGIAAFTLIGAYYSLQFGKNTFSNPDFAFEARYDLADLLAKFLPGAYDTVRPDGLPIVYCGTLSLLLVPFYYFSKRITLREKVFSTIFLAVFIISFTLNPIDIAWHGFQVPNWLNYRYSFMVSFFLLTMTYKAMQQIRKESSKTVFGAGAFIILIVTILEKFEFKNFTLGESDYYVQGKLDTYRTVWFTIAIVIALCAVLYAVIRAKKLIEIKKASKILLIVVCTELLINGIINITALHFDVTYSSYSSYNDFFDKLEPIVSEVQERDTSFYRMEKTHHRKTNDNMTLKMRGLSGSTSTLNKETIKFLNNLGYSSKSHWSKYLGGNPVNDSILGVKYVITQKNQAQNQSTYNENQAVNALMKELYTVFSEDSNYIAYENPYALSIAYQVSSDVKDFSYMQANSDGEVKNVDLSPFERLNKTLSAMIGEETNVFLPIEVNSSDHSNARKSTIAGHTKYAVTTSGTDAYFTLSATAPADAFVFFYAPSEYPREAKFYVNSQKYGDFMANESNRIKSIGKFSAGEDIDIKLTLTGDNFYLKNDEPCLYYLDVTAFKSAMEKLSAVQYNIESYTESSFEGTITTTLQAACVQTTIPYDNGWKVYVDGQEADTYRTFDALIAFDIAEAGEHTVEMVYSPDAIIAGGIISLIFVASFAIYCIIDNYQKKKQLKTNNSKTE